MSKSAVAWFSFTPIMESSFSCLDEDVWHHGIWVENTHATEGSFGHEFCTQLFFSNSGSWKWKHICKPEKWIQHEKKNIIPSKNLSLNLLLKSVDTGPAGHGYHWFSSLLIGWCIVTWSNTAISLATSLSFPLTAIVGLVPSNSSYLLAG